jgi:uncharacterized damage-inducible protein DinB
MTRAEKLAKHIHRTVKGPMWHGPSLAQVLEGFTHDQAAARPITGAHNVWELVLHVTTWAEISRARIKGQRLTDPSQDEDWPPTGPPGPAEWQRALDRLSESHRALSAEVRDLSDDALDANVGELGYSVDVLLHGVVEHGTYHGGQIAVLRKAIANRAAQEEA